MINLGLDNIRALCEKLGNPQDELKFIHIAGTNGKGSVGAYVSSILKTAGYKVGVYSSPAVFNEYEIIRVNGRNISKKDYERLMKQIDAICGESEADRTDTSCGERTADKADASCGESEVDQVAASCGNGCVGIDCSEFEKQTALAFMYFLEKKCDLVVLECGMGGETDATNIVKNTYVSIFTSIGFDHMQYLGNSLKEIASVKAGIIKKYSDENLSAGRVITTVNNPGEVLEVINSRAKKNGCAVYITENDNSLKKVIPLMGEHQIENASIAKAAVKALPRSFVVSDKDILDGLHNTKWPGRFDVISKNPTLIIDGAHNPDAANKLRNALEKYYPTQNKIFVTGMLKDKDQDEVMRIMAPLASSILTVTTEGARSFSATDLAKVALKYNSNVSSVGGIEEALDLAYLMADKKDVIVVFGTLSFLNRVLIWKKNREGK